MTESPAHTVTLTVLAGPMKGRQLVVDEAVDDILIGSDPDCRLCLDDPGVSPIHARLWLDPEGATVFDTHSAGGVYINDDRVNDQAPLNDGDILWLGSPGEGLMLQFRCPTVRPRAAAAAAPPLAAPVSAPPADDWVIEDESAVAPATAAEPMGEAIDDEVAADADLDWPPAAA